MAQNMSICNFCELSNNIKWKCINCDLILCEECKTIKHPKFKGSECHIVIEFNLLGTKESQMQNESQIFRTFFVQVIVKKSVVFIAKTVKFLFVYRVFLKSTETINQPRLKLFMTINILSLRNAEKQSSWIFHNLLKLKDLYMIENKET